MRLDVREIPRATVLRYLTDPEYHAQVWLVGRLLVWAFRFEIRGVRVPPDWRIVGVSSPSWTT